MKNQNRKFLLVLAVLAFLLHINSQSSVVLAQGTAFTYQGRLQNNGVMADGTFNLQFLLYSNNTGGVAIAGPVVTNGMAISNGLFTVTIDFGAAAWNGETNWLEIGVETNGGSSFTTLSPRQRITPTPYAIFAEGANAAGIVGTIPQANLGGTYGTAVNFNNGANSFDGSFYGVFYGDTFVGGNFVGDFIGTGTSLTEVWHTVGNSGTSAGANFVGTTDYQPLELHVNGVRALRLEPTLTTGAVNVIGGSANNSVGAGIVGATIAGGGAMNLPGNSVTFNYGTVGGGYGNIANGYAAVVAGGYQNTNNGFAGFIGAGDGNVIVGNGGGDGAFLGGGYSNTNGGEAATIVGGSANFIGSFANNAAIGGGGYNSIIGSYLFPVFCTVGGGYFNVIQTNVSYATIGGGTRNQIQPGAHSSTIAGGMSNSVSAVYATVAGGFSNNATGPGAFVGGGGYDGTTFLGNQATGGAAVVGGGLGNSANYLYATIGGGQQNTVSYEWGVIAGGQQNIASGAWGSVLGGIYNHATGLQATVGGGANNVASGTAAFIGGGGDDGVSLSGNSASGTISVIGGGSANNASGYAATVPGGYGNIASGSNSFAAGKNAVASQAGAFVWADSQPYPFDAYQLIGPSYANSFNVRTTGGFFIVTGVNTNGGVTSGAYLASGATSWSTLSDRNLKKDFAPVDSQAVLDKLSRVPIEYWRYKWEKNTDVPNLGPMAQDFKAAFYPGRDDKSITTLEFDGVELAAIQGLNKKLELESQKSQAMIQRLESENADLRARLEKLEQLITPKQGIPN